MTEYEKLQREAHALLKTGQRQEAQIAINVAAQFRRDEVVINEDDDDDDDEPIRVPCCRCAQPTTRDEVYGDLCYRCCRADNE